MILLFYKSTDVPNYKSSIFYKNLSKIQKCTNEFWQISRMGAVL